jgi:hypothetical protein
MESDRSALRLLLAAESQQEPAATTPLLNDTQPALPADKCHRSILGTTDMTKSVFELNAFIEENDNREPLHVLVSAPSQAPGQDDYFCRVHAPLLLSGDKNIYGVDADQAKNLAVSFVRSLLSNKKIVDSQGQLVRW